MISEDIIIRAWIRDRSSHLTPLVGKVMEIKHVSATYSDYSKY